MARRDCGQFTWWDRDDADHHIHDDDNHYTLFVPALLLSARCASVSKDVPVPDANTALHGPLRNRDTFIRGRDEITAFLTAKWNRELEYALRKNLWCFEENRIAVRFQYESHDREGRWWRSYGNELWEFNEHGLMIRREASINDLRIDEAERRIFGPRAPDEEYVELPVH